MWAFRCVSRGVSKRKANLGVENSLCSDATLGESVRCVSEGEVTCSLKLYGRQKRMVRWVRPGGKAGRRFSRSWCSSIWSIMLRNEVIRETISK